MEKTEHDRVFERAISAGCSPFWYEGLIGPAWHCGCADNAHVYDSQCSVVRFYKKGD